MVAHGRAEQAPCLAADFRGVLLEGGLSPPGEGLHEGFPQLLRVVTRVPEDSEVVLLWAFGGRHGLGVDTDEVLGIADARPAAVVHESRSFAAGHGIKIQPIAVVIGRPYGRSAHGTEACEE